MTSDRFVEVSAEFTFEAAHCFVHFAEGHPNRRIHGHSFRVQITVYGAPDPTTGFVCEFSELERVAETIEKKLDHHMLNEVEGLGPPSLENLSIWIWHEAALKIPGIKKVTVFRDSCRQSSAYFGPVTVDIKTASVTQQKRVKVAVPAE